MVVNTKAVGMMARDMVKANKLIRMDQFMKAIGEKICQMEEEE